MILLDTHIWHWWVNQIEGKLSQPTIDLIEEADEVAVSAISCFEMAWLVTHGRVELDMPFSEWFEGIVDAQIVTFLPVTPSIAIRSVVLPEHHKDPQDRLIIATALEHHIQLLSFDEKFPSYQELAGLLTNKNL